ncbi:MAG TPA: YidC/Oxa1 family membrane protein insertase [Candidatus Dormibacteraeota bacterium]|nr:YidC/Oxa1 family membrane protein insertase [Candidatus Dormibacteraeota bacterium]
MHLLLATSWLDPIVNVLSSAVLAIDKPINNLGWSLVILAALIRLVFWPLNTAQFKAFLAMQKIAPLIKRVQERHKDDRQKQQQETMALYKEHRVNPFAGCLPMLVQYPVIISVYYVVMNHKALFANQTWLWIGAATNAASVAACKAISISAGCVFHNPTLAPSLAKPDLLLILLYALSMYLSVRYVSMPATDPQQAQTQRMMAVISPIMLGFLGLKYGWPSAMVLYWFAYNVFTMAQQFYLLRRYHQPLAAIDSEHVITQELSGGAAATAGALKGSPIGNGAAKSKQARTARSKRKNKRGA